MTDGRARSTAVDYLRFRIWLRQWERGVFVGQQTLAC